MKGDAQQREDVSKGAKPCVFESYPRPSILISPERLKELGNDIKRQEWRKNIYETCVKKNADLWIDREVTIPGRTGHFHRFFCTDGTRLEAPENQLFTSQEYRCPACGKIYSGEPYEGGRRWLENRWLYFACRDLALVYAVENDERYADKAAEILRKYADAYPGRHTTHLEGGIVYQSLGESVMMIPLAQAYDLLYDSGSLSDDDKTHIEYDLFWESAEGLSKMGVGGNWGSWHLCSVGVIGLATRHQRFFDFGIKHFQGQIRDQLGSDGLWPESVHTYHFYPLQAFVHFAEACANTGIDLYNWQADHGKSLKMMFTAPLAYMYPTGQLPAINDGWYLSFLPVGQYEAAYYRYREPVLAAALKMRDSRKMGENTVDLGGFHDEPWTLVLGADFPETITPRLRPESTDFKNLGICVLRNGAETSADEIMLTFDYGPFLGHGQLDKMGVTLFANNRILAADYGTPGYGSSILPYYQGSLSHNVVIVDGKNQQKSKKGSLDVFHVSPSFKVARSSTDEVYPGATWSRTVALTDYYAFMVDEITSGSTHTFDWFFHAEGDTLAVDGYSLKKTPEAAVVYPYIQEANEYQSDSDIGTIGWKVDNDKELTLYVDNSGVDGMFTARCPAETGARSVPLVVLRKRGTAARFVNILIPRNKARAGSIQQINYAPHTFTIISETMHDEITVGQTITFIRKNEKGKVLLSEEAKTILNQ